MDELERLRRGLEEINDHFDDQSFGAHDTSQCAPALVNYAGAVLNGYDKTLGEWWGEQNQDQHPYRPN